MTHEELQGHKDLDVQRVQPETREFKAMATNARKDIATEPVAISGNLSFPQLDSQSSIRVAADEDADINR